MLSGIPAEASAGPLSGRTRGISHDFKVVSFDLVVGGGVEPFFNGVKNGYFLFGELPEHGPLFFGKQIDWITGSAERR
jgi:hypothetical protein